MKALGQIGLYTVSVFAAKGVSIVMLPIVARYLSPAEYGQLNLLVTFAVVVGLLLTMGVGDTLYRFVSAKDNGEITDEQRQIAANCFTLVLLLSLFVCSILYVLRFYIAEQLPIDIPADYLVYILINLFFTSNIAVPLTLLRICQRAQAFAFFSLLQVVVQAVTCLLLLNFAWQVEAVLMAGAFSAALTFVAIIYFANPLKHMKIQLPNRQMLKYMSMILLSALCMYGLSGAENWFIAGLFGAEQLAQYFVAGHFVLGLSFALEPFRLWWFARRFDVAKYNPNQAANKALLGLQICQMLAIAMLMFGPSLLTWLMPQSFAPAADYITILTLLFVVKTHAELFNLGCYAKQNARFVPVINFISAAIIVCALAVLPKLIGIDGVFYALLIGYITRAVLFWRISQQLQPLPYQLKSILLSWLAFLLACGFALTSVPSYLLILPAVCLLQITYQQHTALWQKVFNLNSG